MTTDPPGDPPEEGTSTAELPVGLPAADDPGAAADAPLAIFEPNLGLRSVLGEAYRRFVADAPRLVVVSAATTIAAFLLPTASASSVVTVIGTILLMAYAADGRGGSSTASRRFAERYLWVFLRQLAAGFVIVVPLLVPGLAWQMAGGFDTPPATVAFAIIGISWTIWVATRLALADAAIVLGDLRLNAAAAASFQMTRPVARLYRIGLVLIVAHLLALPSLGLVVVGPLVELGEPLASIVAGAVVGAAFAPLPVVSVVLYRRLGGPEVEAAGVLRPSAELPRSSRAPLVVAALQLVAGIVGTLAVGPLIVGLLGSGRLAPPDAVPPGEIWFGTGVEIDVCRPIGRATTFDTDDAVWYVAALDDRIRPADTVVLEFRYDGELVASNPVDLEGTDCFSNAEAIEDLPIGRYQLDVLVNGEPGADGAFTVVAR